MQTPLSAPSTAPTPHATDARYTNGRIALYLIVAFGLAWLLELGSYNTSIGTVIGPIGWLPLAAVVVWLILTGRIRHLHL